MKKLTELFETSYGTKLDLNKQVQVDLNSENGGDSVNFVARTARNLGVVARVKKIPNKEPYPAGLITVALGGSILSSFVQQAPFYTAQNLMVLKPRMSMSFQEKVFYCICIRKNAYRYSTFGREANRTLKNIELPAKAPEWVDSQEFRNFYHEKVGKAVANLLGP